MHILRADKKRPLFEEVIMASPVTHFQSNQYKMKDMDIIFPMITHEYVGQVVWTRQPCIVEHFYEKIQNAEECTFFSSAENLFFGTQEILVQVNKAVYGLIHNAFGDRLNCQTL